MPKIKQDTPASALISKLRKLRHNLHIKLGELETRHLEAEDATTLRQEALNRIEEMSKVYQEFKDELQKATGNRCD